MIDNCADDWRIAMTWQRMMLIGVEIAICAVHPIPGRYYFLWTTKLSNHGGKIGSQWVPVDVTLSLPMFFRLYLICRRVHVAACISPETIRKMYIFLEKSNYDCVRAHRHEQKRLSLQSTDQAKPRRTDTQHRH